MIKEDKVIVCDIDNTITSESSETTDYRSLPVAIPVKNKLIELKSKGYWIILFTSRGMRSSEGNTGVLIKNVAPLLFDWLEDNEIPYDEIHFGKPWCGRNGFYVDDRAIRPKEFVENSVENILQIIERDKKV
ncbi:hypothetical protein AKN87_06990 [Thiopseudomonas alkaliphila]|uniref:hypothetical protein n=1 Tax=Thiopseudomonas alkaliphila TaxID=1697053 RepID=UPI00069DF323|nr:hypothetical protein [Thiopseudomonas alkaliphila]AKX44873.1 hypothetical protein AKN87_06990 [Thiopseudomonas alkaliphila]AKX51396.1 hypothetical protein AKN92_07775 [Thiopseudomonas alkaliphila]